MIGELIGGRGGVFGAGEGFDELAFGGDEFGKIGVDVINGFLAAEGETAEGEAGGYLEDIGNREGGHELIDAPVAMFEVHQAGPEEGLATG